ncbi:MAG: hypothetical protein VW907_09825 [Opitutae bacterium]
MKQYNAENGTEFKSIKYDQDGESYSVNAIMEHPGVAILAEDACSLLEKSGGKNYFEFTLMPRIDRGIRPIVITVRWHDGMTPGEKAARLDAALTDLTVTCDVFLQDLYESYPEGLASLGGLLPYIHAIEESVDAAKGLVIDGWERP